MTYRCPHCRGEFPDGDCCPWCGTPLDESYSPDQWTHKVSYVSDNSENDHAGGLLGRLFK